MYPPVFLPLGQDFVGNLNKFTSCRTRFQGLHKHGPYKGKLGEELGQMGWREPGGGGVVDLHGAGGPVGER